MSVNYEELQHRIDQFIILERYCLSMAMVAGVMDGLAQAYNIPKKKVISLWNERHKQIDLEASDVHFDVVEK